MSTDQPAPGEQQANPPPPPAPEASAALPAPAPTTGPTPLPSHHDHATDLPPLTDATSIAEVQHWLAVRASTDHQHRFAHLFDVLTWPPLLEAALDRLLTRAGSRTAGPDGITGPTLAADRNSELTALRQQLLDGSYQPAPVRRAYIPKSGGRQRPLGIPNLADRWVQTALKLILEPIFESDFAPFSHGFRPLRSCNTAMAHLRMLALQRRDQPITVIEGDIESFFDHVQHERLLALLGQRIADQRIFDLILRTLRAGVMEGNVFTPMQEGTPQGSPLSPLLANVYLNHFDHWLAQQAAAQTDAGATHPPAMVRYADDFCVLTSAGPDQAAALKATIKDWLASELQLTISLPKTLITDCAAGFNFLGYTVQQLPSLHHSGTTIRYRPSDDAIAAAKEILTSLTNRGTLVVHPKVMMRALNTFLRGWSGCFRHSYARDELRAVGQFAYGRLWRWLVATHPQAGAWQQVRTQYERGGTWRIGRESLLRLDRLKYGYPPYRHIANPYLAATVVQAARVCYHSCTDWADMTVETYLGWRKLVGQI